jgi:Protein of unknown function (DUF2905)
MADLGKLLMGLGVVLVVVGGLLVAGNGLGGRLPFLGRLPGDIFVQRGNWSFYFPLTTSIIVSVLLTLLFALFRHR